MKRKIDIAPEIVECKQRESFIFYRSFEEVIDGLPDNEQLALYRAIVRFGLYHEEPELTGISAKFWKLIMPQLHANWIKYLNSLKGGAPVGNNNASKAKQPKNNLNSTENQPPL